MKKAQPVSEDVTGNSEHLQHFPGDDTISNYGMLDDKLVKIDYADLDLHWGEDFKP